MYYIVIMENLWISSFVSFSINALNKSIKVI